MPNVNQIFRLLNEALFILVGGLLVLFALTGRYLFDPRRPAWLVLAAVLVLWGLRTWRQARITVGRGERAAMRIGGISLAIVGLIMLSLAWAPFHWAGLLLAAAGSVFVLRGLVVAVVIMVHPT